MNTVELVAAVMAAMAVVELAQGRLVEMPMDPFSNQRHWEAGQGTAVVVALAQAPYTSS
jgi:hypothetical protein